MRKWYRLPMPHGFFSPYLGYKKKAINGFHVHEIGTTHHAFAYGRFRNSCVRHMMQRKALASWKQSLIS